MIAKVLRQGFAVIAVTCASISQASENCTEDAMIVFDGSGSMAETGFNQIGDPRIFSAREAMREVMPQVAPVRRIGLLIYGPGPEGECANLDLRFPPIHDAAGPVIAAVEQLNPDGSTPLTAAVLKAATTLDYENAPGTVVLVTDGKETCGGFPCQLASELAGTAADLTVHVIGFKVRGDRFSWDSQGVTDYNDAVTPARCLADRTGGLYVSAESVEELVAAMRQTLGCLIIM